MIHRVYKILKTIINGYYKYVDYEGDAIILRNTQNNEIDQ